MIRALFLILALLATGADAQSVRRPPRELLYWSLTAAGTSATVDVLNQTAPTKSVMVYVDGAVDIVLNFSGATALASPTNGGRNVLFKAGSGATGFDIECSSISHISTGASSAFRIVCGY